MLPVNCVPTGISGIAPDCVMVPENRYCDWSGLQPLWSSRTPNYGYKPRYLHRRLGNEYSGCRDQLTTVTNCTKVLQILSARETV
jgi:hypothetical protein